MTSKTQNRLNLLIVLFVLIIVVACSCPTVRDGERSQNDDKAPTTDKQNGETKNSSASQKPDKGDFVVQHSTVKNPRFAEIDRQIKEEKVLEKAADKLNRTLSLPNNIPLRTKDCGNANAYYDKRDRSCLLYTSPSPRD